MSARTILPLESADSSPQEILNMIKDLDDSYCLDSRG
jgi:hypothetical protein